MPAEPTMSVEDFVAKWQRVSAGETQASQSHFNDLCAVLGVENPIEGDPEGVAYAFEKGVKRPDGSTGQADVRKERYFGWEYKGKKKNLAAAYEQLLGYREGLGNPPLLVVCEPLQRISPTPNSVTFRAEGPTRPVRSTAARRVSTHRRAPNNDPREGLLDASFSAYPEKWRVWTCFFAGNRPSPYFEGGNMPDEQLSDRQLRQALANAVAQQVAMGDLGSNRRPARTRCSSSRPERRRQADHLDGAAPGGVLVAGGAAVLLSDSPRSIRASR